MKRILSALALAGAFLLGQTAHAQTTTITAQNIADVGGNPVTGSFCVKPAQQFVRGGGGNVVPIQVCYSVTVGVLQSGVVLADTSLTNPANVCYGVTILNAYQEPVASYACMQPSGSTYSFDNFVQASPPYVNTSFTVPLFSYNGTQVAIQNTLNFTGPGVSYYNGTWTFSGNGSGSMTWPSLPGIAGCTGTPCTAWGTSYGVDNPIPADFVNLSTYLASSVAASTYQPLLGFTPYNATNPAGYIAASALSPYTPTASLGTGAFATIANYLTTSAAASTYQPLLGFTPYNATNPAGYIAASALSPYTPTASLGTGAFATIANYLTTSAAASTYQPLLGFTPYNSTNPSAYITASALSPYALTSALSAYQLALGFTPYNATNPSGFITASALTSYLTSTAAASTYEPKLGNPTTSGYVLSSSVAGVRSWIANGAGAQTWPSLPGLAVCTGTPCTGWGTSLTAPASAIVGISDTQSLTNKTLDGVTPTVMGYIDASSSIQAQLNGKQAVLGFTAVPNTVTVNGHVLSTNVTVSASDVGLGSVTNDAQTKAAILPNTAPAAGKIPVGNTGGTAYAPVAISGDCTLGASGALTCTKSSGTSFGTAAFDAASAFDASGAASTAQTNAEAYAANASNLASGTVPATRLPAALANSNSVNGTSIPASVTLTQTIASGTATLGTAAIASDACASVVTVAATGVETTDNISADFNGDPTSTLGFEPGAMLTILKYPTAGDVNFLVCNNSGSSSTPGAITLNWRVTR